MQLRRWVAYQGNMVLAVTGLKSSPAWTASVYSFTPGALMADAWTLYT